MNNKHSALPPAISTSLLLIAILILSGCGGAAETPTPAPSNDNKPPIILPPPVVTPPSLMGGAVQTSPLNINAASAVVSTLAGSGTPGSSDGATTSASFNLPADITTDGSNLYVTDNWNHKIRKVIISTGAVSTLAGSGAQGSLNATGAAASFNYPYGITNDGYNIYLTDQYNHKIRKIIIATGVVSTLAGSGIAGYLEGVGSAARFNLPAGITTDNTSLYVADSANHRIRKIELATGVVTTFAGTGTPGFLDGAGSSAQFSSPQGITTDGQYLYVTDNGNNRIRRITLAGGAVDTLAGSGSSGAADGTGTGASFNSPAGITTDGAMLYITDNGNHRIRVVVIASGAVTTLAGTGPGATDGSVISAKFQNPQGIITDGNKLFVTDTNNHKIRIIQ